MHSELLIEMRPSAHATAVDAVVTTMYTLTAAIAVVRTTVFAPDHLYAVTTAASPILPSRNGSTILRAETDCAAPLPTVSVCRMSTGTHRMATIVSAFRENGLWCRTTPL